MYTFAQKPSMLWHYNHYKPYLEDKYEVIDCIHTSENMDSKTEPMSKFLFNGYTSELEKELHELGFEVVKKDKKIKLK